jgi:membrane-bound lytic murein transglycosylase A
VVTRAQLLSLFLLVFTGCVTVAPKISAPPPIIPPPTPLVTRASALIRLAPDQIPSFVDDVDSASLRTAALHSLDYYQVLPENQLFVLGTDTYTAKEMADSMISLAALLVTSTGSWTAHLGDSFNVYQSVGVDSDRTVVFSSYYEPTIPARLTQSSSYRYPIYARPPDLVDVNLGQFDPVYEGARIAGRRQGNNLVPYPTRMDIDSGNRLKGQGLELAWAKDPVDILDLQIEGSGWLDVGGGRQLRIRYDGNNGRKYHSVGQNMIAAGVIPADKFSRKAYLQYLSSHPEERQNLLNVDERYIFFQVDTSSGSAAVFGNIEVPLTAGRSIALDPKVFPKGALVCIDLGKMRRFVLNQDEGGAIQGPGRVDIFAGHGAEAAEFATHMWNKGKLYFLVKKRT